tara:strand:+ start:2500 stop:2682 length:183 start_codon:yes stop_codon:yes gene_type:complete
MIKKHPNMEEIMTIQDMNESRAVTIRRVLQDGPLLMQLREEDRKELIDLYIKNLEKWENR